MTATDRPLLVTPRVSDLGGGFVVRRALPAPARRSVGPFVFLDQMGPVDLAPGQGLDVRPHPHIGLATLTWLYEGEILHRDSLGSLQPIRPGEVNWMVAGRGIVHSERSPDEARRAGSRLSGIQVWIALPRELEEAEPAFSHHAATSLPVIASGDATITLVAGTWMGLQSPVPVASPLVQADVALPAGGTCLLPAEHAEQAVHVAQGSVDLDESPPDGSAHGEGHGAGDALHVDAGQLAVLPAGRDVRVRAGPRGARLMLVGGAPLDAPRFVWWNFVSSSRERIERAKADWQAGRFAPVPDETEAIPLPEQPATQATPGEDVRYP